MFRHCTTIDYSSVKGKPSGTYPVTPPAEKTIVTLTAKAEKAGIAKEKNFTVTVFPENSNPSLDDWFDAAIPKELTTDIDLPANYDGTSATAITWTSSNDAALRIQQWSSLKGCITRDLVDQPVILTAKLTYNSQAIEKPISITVKRLTRVEHSGTNGDRHFISDIIDFPGNEIIITKEFRDRDTGKTEKFGTRFSYTDLDIPHKRFKAQGTHTLSNDGTWVAIGSAEHRKHIEAQVEGMGSYRRMAKLFNRPRITLRDFAAVFRLPLSAGEQELFDMLHKNLPLSVSSYTAFKKLSETEQTGVLKKWIDGMRKGIALAVSLPETASWEDLLQKVVDDRFNKEKQKASPKIYGYEIWGNGSYTFNTHTTYEKGKKWFEEDGTYSHYGSESNGKRIWFSDHGLNFRYGEEFYSGKLNSDGTEFTGKKRGSSESITVTIKDNKNGTITIQVNGHTYTLNFYGHGLHA